MQAPDIFPLSGVIGVVAESGGEVELAKAKGLTCIELRADLLLDNGVSESGLFDLVKSGKENGLGVLFTLRHPTHGGTFQGTEDERVTMSCKAIDAGADLFDLEWGTEAATLVPGDRPPMILSYHDFNGMPDQMELDELTRQMVSAGARAIKVVPTAATIDDALTMLKWTRKADSEVSRIGFAMGQAGSCSRILTTANGGEVTYASFGAPVAPGQIDIDEMITLYRIGDLDSQAQITAVCIEGDAGKRRVSELNTAFAGSNSVAVGFQTADMGALELSREWMRIVEIVS